MDPETARILAEALHLQSEQNNLVFMATRRLHVVSHDIWSEESKAMFKANQQTLETLIRELEGIATLP